MARRRYNQYCALAHALDRIGERWTLLIVRELLTGPRRYKDLLAALPGIGTNLLANRLQQLEKDGLIQRTTLPPPAGSPVYELTPEGRALEPALLALMKWARPSLGRPRKGQFARPGWALLAMKSTFRPQAARGVRETYEFRLDDEVFHVRVHDGALETAAGPAGNPALVLTATNQNFLALATGRLPPKKALASGVIKIDGSRRALQRSFAIFGAPSGK